MDGVFTRPKKEVRADLERVMGQVAFLLDGASSAPKDYDLEEVTIALGFSAKGQIVFIAEAGVSATITVTFRRTRAPGN